MKSKNQPNIKDFLKYIKKKSPETELTQFQKELAKSMIEYRIKHFSGGRQGGRTFVINAVQSYFTNIYSNYPEAGKEI